MSLIEHLRASLPSQGPMDVFVHHNTLHHYEDQPFEAAVEAEARERGAEPYLRHAEYLAALDSGRIAQEDVAWAVGRHMPVGEGEVAGRSRKHLRRMLLQIESVRHSESSLRWALHEGHWLGKPYARAPRELCDAAERDAAAHLAELSRRGDFDTLSWLIAEPGADHDARGARRRNGALLRKGGSALPLVFEGRVALRMLWNVVASRVETPVVESAAAPGATTGFLVAAPGSLDRVDRATIALVSAYLDRGQARWALPRADGLLSATLGLLRDGERGLPDFLRWTPEVDGLWNEVEGRPAAVVVEALLARLGVSSHEAGVYLRRELAPVSGWAGTISALEQSPRFDTPPASLAEFVALRLLLRVADGKRPEAAPRHETTSLASLRLQFFALCQLVGITARELLEMPSREVARLALKIAVFDGVARRRVLHAAYERSFQRRMLAAVARPPSSAGRAGRPTFQAVFCLDEREESIRRHLEETAPSCETFGAAGFFGVAVLYRGPDVPWSVPLCPVVVTPKHVVAEQPLPTPRRRDLARRIARLLHSGSRGSLLGQMLATAGGCFAAFPLALAVARPRAGAKILREVFDESRRGAPEFEAAFTVPEMIDRVEALLRTIGLVGGFSRVVLLLGHGSTTTNNPFASAYECGACGGHRGDRNGRILALMANRPDVRKALAARGIVVPDDTVFIGGCHDTCSDDVDLFDLVRVPASHADDLAHVTEALSAARALNAHERSRRFEDAEGLEPRAALAHVQARASSWREPRPEYGHGSNAWCYVGPRASTRGLFLDRRCFLVSYDAAADAQGEILERILAAITPVCSGISLEYFFSRVDNRRYGAGTKLPHNPTGMIGVMEGTASDLRTGLPWQTVEIHEPMRLFLVVETKPATLQAVVERLPGVRTLAQKLWVHLGVVDPDTREAYWYDGVALTPFSADASARLPAFSRSRDVYEGTSGHLWPARVDSAEVPRFGT